MNFNKLHIVLPGEIREKCPVFFLKSLLRINYLYNPLPLNKVYRTTQQRVCPGFTPDSLFIALSNAIKANRLQGTKLFPLFYFTMFFLKNLIYR